ncbi:MAG: hypothetical protein JOZ75_01710 [Candidatus Dormibacteraeota bacterium]|nr:hypothetical protein [Candidatus Dormibacteraeota bacterium]
MQRRPRVIRIAIAAVAALIALSVVVAVRADGQAPSGRVPVFRHVGVLVLENESESATWGASSVATYLNSLVPSGAFAQNYFADGHVSLDNYITMTSGQAGNPSTDSDCIGISLYACQQTVNTPLTGNGANIGDQAEHAGLTWKEYADSMPQPCFHATLDPTSTASDPYQGDSTAPPAGNYADRHNAFNYYSDVTGNASRCAAHDVPFTGLASDLANNTVPNYFFITPDTCHDGHDNPCAGAQTGGLAAADAWLRANLPSLLRYMKAHDGVLFITTDEGSATDLAGCCTGGPGGLPGFGGKVGLLALGAHVRGGSTSTVAHDHASLLRTTEDALGISTHLNNAASATSMSDLFSAGH